jgi:membrane protease YdiL (CAAX protease family)
MKFLINNIQILILCLVVLNVSVFSQEKEVKPKNEKSPSIAALLGIIPGAGQAYIGNLDSAAVQAGTFASIFQVRRHFLEQPDYININEREVKFNNSDAVLGYFFQRQGYVYNDLPIVSESKYDRLVRLYQEGALAEQNPLVKYGEYSRASRSSVYADTLGNPVLSTIFYSIYSSYRDAGGLGEDKKNETLADISFSPFNPTILKNPLVFSPILVIALLAGYSNATYDGSNPILVPKSVKQDGSLVGSAFVSGISPAIGEEAFFRGYLNYTYIQRFGPAAGLLSSGTMFMLAHEGNSDAASGRASRLFAGLYLGTIHYLSNYDIRPGVAVHFWYNLIIGLSELSHYKADHNYDKTQREVYYMPIQFSFSL